MAATKDELKRALMRMPSFIGDVKRMVSGSKENKGVSFWHLGIPEFILKFQMASAAIPRRRRAEENSVHKIPKKIKYQQLRDAAQIRSISYQIARSE